MNRTPCTGYQCQRIPTIWRIAKIITMLATRNWSPNSFCPLYLGSQATKDDTAQLCTGWKNAFTHTLRRQSKTTSNNGYQYLTGSRCPWPVMPGNWPMCTPLLPQQREPNQSSVESETLKAGSLPKAHWHWHLSNTKELPQDMKQKKILPHKVTSPAQAILTLYVFIRQCFRPKAHCYIAECGLINCAWHSLS